MKILSWNILAGGGRRADDIVSVIAAHRPDIVTLQEFRNGRAGARILAGLKAAGLTHIYFEDTESARENTLLIAAKNRFDAGQFLQSPQRPVPIIEAFFPATNTGFDLSFLCVHFPHKKAQVPLFCALIDDSPSLLRGAAIIIGDMNCGIPLIDSDKKTFYASRHYRQLLHQGWIDCWRSRNEGAREFSWESPRTGNRFRYDQMLASAQLNNRIAAAYYDHRPREHKISDHSAMIVQL